VNTAVTLINAAASFVFGKFSDAKDIKEDLMEDRDKKYKTPQGTVVLMIVFVLLIIALWGSTYLTLLARGVTG
jgi:hypothetical protein